jgi:hypothetical protein
MYWYVMNLRHGLQHLDIKPGNLLLVGEHIKVADFGLVRSVADCGVSSNGAVFSGGMTALYSAPEMFHNAITSWCDRYSLAIVYQELLAGVRPFNGKNARQLMMQHCTAEPDLTALPEDDRAAVMRALSKDAEKRFPTCTTFVQALEASGKPESVSLTETIRAGTTLDTRQLVACTERLDALENSRSAKSESLRSVEQEASVAILLAELIVEAKGMLSAPEANRWTDELAGEKSFRRRFPARLPPNPSRAVFETFRRQWNAEIVCETANGIVFQVPFRGGFWTRWLSGAQGPIVEVRWTRPRPNRATLPEVSVRIRSCDGKDQFDKTLIHQVGPLILDSLRSQLDAFPERRTQERVSWPHPVRAAFLRSEDEFDETIDGKGKDISLGGMGLYLPRAPALSRIRLELYAPSRGEPIVLSGHCVRLQRCSDGWFEAGVLF